MLHLLRAVVMAAMAMTVFPAVAGVLADLHVVSRSSGQRLPVYAHGGRLYIAGQPGERYSVQVANRGGQRILAVISVDGINVVSGETASPDQTGYVFSPYQSYEIAGWRKNADEVAAFYFTALPDSYAARTDRPADVGVIGVAVFREWRPPRQRPQVQSRANEDAAGVPAESAREERSADANAAGEAAAGPDQNAQRPAPAAPARRLDKLGTGHGEREHSAVSFTDFRRATAHPAEVLTLYYDRYENLVARGIIPGTPQHAQPRPFPGAVRFVPDPRR
jgi:hypothetical protein